MTSLTESTEQFERNQLVAPSWRRVLLQDPCVYCGASASELDHIHPKSRGGTDGWENRAPSCVSCGQAKAHYALVAFLLGDRIAAHRTAKRRYRTHHDKRQAMLMIRRHIAEQFYRGNIRLEGVRLDEEAAC